MSGPSQDVVDRVHRVYTTVNDLLPLTHENGGVIVLALCMVLGEQIALCPEEFNKKTVLKDAFARIAETKAMVEKKKAAARGR